MTSQSSPSHDYLIVDQFMQSLVAARALRSAFDIGMIDLMESVPSLGIEDCVASVVQGQDRLDPKGALFLIDLLSAANVLRHSEGVLSSCQLTDAFRLVLQFRDLLEAKLDFALYVAADFADLFPLLIADTNQFMARSRLMNLFDYQRALETDEESIAHTWNWVRLTTALTRYETEAYLRIHDIAAFHRMCDIGGNSGEFARQHCCSNSLLRATVFDLPAVCEVGRRYLSQQPGGDRVNFVVGNALVDPLPQNVDLFTFKSMLHDWPDDAATHLLERVADALLPGGTVVIFERGPFGSRVAMNEFHLLPMLLFFRSFRKPDFYRSILASHGLDVEVRHLFLEMPFFLVTGRKPVG